MSITINYKKTESGNYVACFDNAVVPGETLDEMKANAREMIYAISKEMLRVYDENDIEFVESDVPQTVIMPLPILNQLLILSNTDGHFSSDDMQRGLENIHELLHKQFPNILKQQ